MLGLVATLVGKFLGELGITQLERFRAEKISPRSVSWVFFYPGFAALLLSLSLSISFLPLSEIRTVFWLIFGLLLILIGISFRLDPCQLRRDDFESWIGVCFVCLVGVYVVILAVNRTEVESEFLIVAAGIGGFFISLYRRFARQ